MLRRQEPFFVLASLYCVQDVAPTFSAFWAVVALVKVEIQLLPAHFPAHSY